MRKESLLLVVAAAGLAPIALSYGLNPSVSLSYLFDIDANDINTAHIFRAVMGLYFAMLVFWLLGAKNDSLRLPALWSLSIFMLGLASGRAISLLVDGMPHPLLAAYLVIELGFGAIAYIMAKSYKDTI